jgi:hypothetical protein
MPTYLITNRLPGGFAGSADAFAARTAWFERPGDNLAGRSDPAFMRTTVGNCGPGTVLDESTLVTTGRLGEPAAPAPAIRRCPAAAGSRWPDSCC